MRFIPGVQGEGSSTSGGETVSVSPSAPIEASTAVEIARQYVLDWLEVWNQKRQWFAREFGDTPQFEAFDAGSIRFRPSSSSILGGPHTRLPPLETLWAVELVRRTIEFTSGVVILVSKIGGRVVYFGSANDEG